MRKKHVGKYKKSIRQLLEVTELFQKDQSEGTNMTVRGTSINGETFQSALYSGWYYCRVLQDLMKSPLSGSMEKLVNNVGNVYR